MNEPDDIAMQTRCVNCLTEHWAPAVMLVSYGDMICRCGHTSQPMTYAEYADALHAAMRRREEQRAPQQRRPQD